MTQLNVNDFFGEQNRYQLIRLLDRRQSLEVWLADDMQSGATVALKLYYLDKDGNIRYELFEQIPCMIIPDISGVWLPETNRFVENRPKEKQNTAGKKIIVIAATLIIGLCAGFVAGKGSKNNPMLHECIVVIEQADALFSDTDKTTWKDVLVKYRKVKEIIEKYKLQLPNMEARINHLHEKIETAINQGIETAKIFYSGGSPSMALTTLENEVLKIDPEHQEGNELKEEYSKSLKQQ